MRDRLVVAGMMVGVLGLMLACKGKAGDAADKSASTAVVDVPLATLLAEYKNNEVRADAAYKGKTIRVAGTVNETKKDITDSIYVVVGNGGPFELETVHCSVPKKSAAAAAALDKGTPVTVTGKVTGLIMMSVMLDDCEIAPGPKVEVSKVGTAESACAALVTAEGGGTCAAGTPSTNPAAPTMYQYMPADASKTSAAVVIQFKDSEAMAKNAGKITAPEASLCRCQAKAFVVQFIDKPTPRSHAATCAKLTAAL